MARIMHLVTPQLAARLADGEPAPGQPYHHRNVYRRCFVISNDLDAVTEGDTGPQALPYRISLGEIGRRGLVLCEECLQLLADREEAAKPQFPPPQLPGRTLGGRTWK